MSTLKLYTEEKIIETFSTGVLSLYKGYIKERLETLTPIELPSDREIENNAYTDRRVDDLDYQKQIGFDNGAKWMKEQILNQNK